ncbi:PAAR domain-containing protein, partial [Metapseudomonas otitidis]|uniref:PAAR domain-containing protein n=1 Tax=Metapseudomonas otitidis TaxID=319939 RepID=UPI001AAE3A55
MSGKPAARQTDPTTCPVPGHGTNPIATGSPDVLFDNLPAARMTDTSACGSPIVGAVASTVLINGLPAATLGSTGGHGSVVIGGSGSVIIGDTSAMAPFTAPSAPAIKASITPVSRVS